MVSSLDGTEESGTKGDKLEPSDTAGCGGKTEITGIGESEYLDGSMGPGGVVDTFGGVDTGTTASKGWAADTGGVTDMGGSADTGEGIGSSRKDSPVDD